MFINNGDLNQQKKGRAGSSSRSLLVTRESALLAMEMKFHLEDVTKERYCQRRMMPHIPQMDVATERCCKRKIDKICKDEKLLQQKDVLRER